MLYSTCVAGEVIIVVIESQSNIVKQYRWKANQSLASFILLLEISKIIGDV
jgi:hypothetical protein